MEYKFSNKNQLKIIQLTDSHLFSINSPLFGVNCNERLQDLIERFKDELDDTDFILLTGDLSQDESPESYQFLLNLIEPLGKPAFWIPGNHDDIEVMSKVFSKSNLMSHKSYIELKHWIFIFLNTKINDSINGELNSSELDLIQDKLENSDKNIALIMHHHPAPVNTPLIDTYMLNHSSNLWDLISDSSVKLIITGHVHGDYSFKFNNVVIECSPATCFQFAKGASSLQIENKSGYKIHYFDGSKFRSKAILMDF